jgi:class 3 adenylate cyclase
MTFEQVLDQAIAMLQRRGRVTYRALKRQFNLDDDYLEDLKVELIQGQRLAADEDGAVLVWIGRPDVSPTPPPSAPQPALSGPPLATPTVHDPHNATSPVTPPPWEAERRQLTVLFCDLVDSTVLASQLDPEEWREVVRAYQQTCATVIQRYEGYIAQYLGDGLLAYFGYPHAHEDDPQRAVRTGLEIVEAMGTLHTQLARDNSPQLAVRVGIHTGLVVVGEIGSGGSAEPLALGDTPNIASRLQGLATPNTVVISADTHRLVQGYFTVDALGSQPLKGVTAPLHVYRILGESGTHSRLDVAATRGLTPFVGREQEAGLLLDRWAQAHGGMGQVVILHGEAGIGKSRLLQVLKERVAGESVTRIEFRCSPYHVNSVLYPVIEQVERLLQFRRDDSPEAKLDKLARVLEASRLPLAEVMPLVAALLLLPHPAQYPSRPLSPRQQRQKTQEALVAWLMEETERRPVLAVCEDLHWADPSTLECLSLLVDQAPTARLLLLLTHRPGFRPPWEPRSHLTQLTLGRLGRAQIEAMILSLTGGKPLPADILEPMIARSDGVPLFVEEFTKTVLESGWLRERVLNSGGRP